MCMQGYSIRKPILSKFLLRRKHTGRPMAQSPPRIHRNSHQHMPKFLRSVKALRFLASCTFPSYYCGRGKLEFPSSGGPAALPMLDIITDDLIDMNIFCYLYGLCDITYRTLCGSLRFKVSAFCPLSKPRTVGKQTSLSLVDKNVPFYSPSHGVPQRKLVWDSLVQCSSALWPRV